MKNYLPLASFLSYTLRLFTILNAILGRPIKHYFLLYPEFAIYHFFLNDFLCLISYLFVQREDAVDNFRAGKTWVLIATDVIARGMDFKGVNCVINYDFPESAAAYIHRIGKTPDFNSWSFLLTPASDVYINFTVK